jgi:hypothetical protein
VIDIRAPEKPRITLGRQSAREIRKVKPNYAADTIGKTDP